MFKVGDKVYINDTADIDCTESAWEFVNDHRKATVKGIKHGVKPYLNHTQLALEFDEDFPGGHYCAGVCSAKRGQYVMANNVALCFEESREVVTVPNIEGYNEKEQVSQD